MLPVALGELRERNMALEWRDVEWRESAAELEVYPLGFRDGVPHLTLLIW